MNTLNKTNTIFINKIKVEIKSPKVVINQYGIVTSNYYQYELKVHNFTGIIIGKIFFGSVEWSLLIVSIEVSITSIISIYRGRMITF